MKLRDQKQKNLNQCYETFMLNIIEHDFGDEIQSTDYEGFPIYVDYYKKVEPKY